MISKYLKLFRWSQRNGLQFRVSRFFLVTARWRRAALAARHGRRHPSALIAAVAGRRIQAVGSEALDERTGGHHGLGHCVGRLESSPVGFANQSRVRDTVPKSEIG